MKRVFSAVVAAALFASAACNKSTSSDGAAPSGDEGKKKKDSPAPAKTKEKQEGEAPQKPASKGDLPSRVDRTVEKAMTDLHLPGVSVTVVHDGEIVVQKGYGFADVDAKTPMTTETTLGLASITKVFTTIAVLALVDAQKVKLEDPYSKYVSDCPVAWKAITVRQLLAMQSGIHSPDMNKMSDWKAAVAWAAGKPLLFPPGTKTNYANVNFVLLGHLIESVSGKSYEAYLGDAIFAPTGMKSTRLNADPAPAGRATPYEWKNGHYAKASLRASAFSSGGLVSNQLDLTKLDEAMRAKRLISAESWDAMFTPQPHADGSPSPRGLGWDFVRVVKGKKRAGKAGDGNGWKTFFLHGIDEGVTVIILANAHDKKLNGVAQSIYAEAVDAKDEPVPADDDDDNDDSGE